MSPINWHDFFDAFKLLKSSFYVWQFLYAYSQYKDYIIVQQCY